MNTSSKAVNIFLNYLNISSCIVIAYVFHTGPCAQVNPLPWLPSQIYMVTDIKWTHCSCRKENKKGEMEEGDWSTIITQVNKLTQKLCNSYCIWRNLMYLPHTSLIRRTHVNPHTWTKWAKGNQHSWSQPIWLRRLSSQGTGRAQAGYDIGSPEWKSNLIYSDFSLEISTRRHHSQQEKGNHVECSCHVYAEHWSNRRILPKSLQ